MYKFQLDLIKVRKYTVPVGSKPEIIISSPFAILKNDPVVDIGVS